MLWQLKIKQDTIKDRETPPVPLWQKSISKITQRKVRHTKTTDKELLTATVTRTWRSTANINNNNTTNYKQCQQEEKLNGWEKRKKDEFKPLSAFP